jgi:hypothetical protein
MCLASRAGASWRMTYRFGIGVGRFLTELKKGELKA